MQLGPLVSTAPQPAPCKWAIVFSGEDCQGKGRRENLNRGTDKVWLAGEWKREQEKEELGVFQGRERENNGGLENQFV